MPKKPPSAEKRQRNAVVVLSINGAKYSGKSSGQYGHAEMVALRKFIGDVGGNEEANEILALKKNFVTCLNQPVCLSCTLILKALKFRSRGGTKFGTKASGGVSWGANLVVDKFMTDRGDGSVLSRAYTVGRK